MKLTGFAAIAIIAFFVLFAAACQPTQQSSTPAEENSEQPSAVQETPDETSETPTASGEEAEDETTGDEEEKSEDESITVDKEDNGTVVISDGEGSTVTMTSNLPENWPQDVPVMDGFTVMHSSVIQDPSKEVAINVSASGDATPEEVIDYYTNHLPGWDLQGTMTQQIGDTACVMVFQRDDEMLNISYILASEDGPDQNMLVLYYTSEH
jgi:hypothetical protein